MKFYCGVKGMDTDSSDSQSIGERKTLKCSRCETFFIYYLDDELGEVPDKCSLCGGDLKSDVLPNIKPIKPISLKPKCSECGKPTWRKILGVFVCKDCYGYEDVPKGRKDITNCEIEFHPELMICRDCDYYKDCKSHYVAIEPNKNKTLDMCLGSIIYCIVDMG